MNALVIDRLGGPEVYRMAEMPIPEPGKGQIQVKVDGAGMNPVDWKIREGRFPPATPREFPAITLRDFSGIVTKVGPGVTRLSEGDAVYGITDSGAAAEYTIANASAVASRPRSMHPWDAAVVPLAGMTAWQALFDHGNIRAGQRVLIHAASGGVGTYAVQLAKWAGCTVIGTCGPEHVDAVWRLGADEVIDYHKERFEDVLQPVDMVLHSIGQDEVPASLKVLKLGGIMVCISCDPMEAQAAALGKLSIRFMMQPQSAHLERLAELIDNGTIRPVIEEVVSLDRVPEAMVELEKGHTLGKVGVRMI